MGNRRSLRSKHYVARVLIKDYIAQVMYVRLVHHLEHSKN